MKKQAGFTIIELVVVIALLGILAAVALPRFLNVTDDAHNAAVEGTAGGFAAGIALAKAKAVVENAVDGDGVELEGTVNVTVNSFGYPVGTSGATATTALTDAECVDVWDAVLQGSRPTASSASTSVQGIDFSTSGTPGDTTCTFIYRVNNTSNAGNTQRVITYDSATGDVTVTGTVDN